MAAEETDLIICWDCGCWFLRPKGLKTRYTSTVTSFAAGSRFFVASINLSPTETIKEVVFSDNGKTFLFDGLTVADAADWLKPDDWSLLRVTTRGTDVANERMLK